MQKESILDLKLQQFELLSRKEEMKRLLPHIYGWPWYKWARTFYESTNPINLLCAANQISKSSTQIRKMINWATDKSLWPKIWGTQPRQFWYLYPSRDVIDAEFRKKWEPEFLPRGEMKDHPVYGWKVKNKQGIPNEIIFNSGVSCFLKSYTQDVNNLQSGTVHAIFTDEELPVNLYDELILRLAASEGIFNMVFTATRGQDFWRCAVERIGERDETLKEALKIQVSMYDCLEYEDGSKTTWSKSKIQKIKNKCKSEAEIKRRVYGRFVLDSGLKYPAYSSDRNLVKPYPIPRDWNIYSGVDIGSGGVQAHPAAGAFIAVRPDFQKGAVFKGWLGDHGVETTSSDILTKYRLVRGSSIMTEQYYDHSAADFKTYTSRLGETFVPAEKSHEIGEDIINVLFKNKMLDIFDTEELAALPQQLTSLLTITAKKFAVDDYIDAMRYGVTKIPWDYTAITDELIIDFERKDPILTEIEERRAAFKDNMYEREEIERVEDEIEAYNELNEY